MKARKRPAGKKSSTKTENINFFMFGGALRTGRVKPANKKMVQTILRNSQRAFALQGEKLPDTATKDLETICSHRRLETAPLEKIAEEIQKYFLKHGINLLTWKE